MSEPRASIDADVFRSAMAQLASAVHLVTTDGPGGRAGFTASAVCSVSDMPPTLLVCLNRSSSAFPAFRDNDVLCVNTLAGAHLPVARAFSGKTSMETRFASASWLRLATEAPVLAGAIVAFDCRIVWRTTMGTHDVMFGEIVAIATADNEDSLVYSQRRFHALPRTSPQQASHRHVA